jgi:hypothetical protein
VERERDLEGCGLAGEGKKTVTRGVLMEVDKQVDLIGADLVGELGIRERGSVLEMIGEGLEVGGDGIGCFRIGVEKCFDLRFVVKLENG